MLLLPDIVNTQDQLDALASMLAAATRAIETYCRRWLALTSIDRFYRPGRTRRIYLHSWPVAPGMRLKCDLATAFTIFNNAISSYAVGYAQMTPANYYSWTPKTLTLTTVDNTGTQANVPLALASYPTIGALVNAINAAGNGWQASVIGNSYNAQQLSSWPTSELIYDPGMHGALNQQYDVYVYCRDIVRYGLDYNRGVIELTENRPEAYRYADKAYGIGFGWSWSAAAEPKHANVRAIYQAGYAVLASDVAAGLEPCPEDLQLATALTAQAMLNTAPMMGPVKSQSVKDRSYELADDPSLIPMAARVILDSRYVNNRIAI